MTALIWAACEGHEAVVRLLLEGGADREARDQDGTALENARKEGHDGVVLLLEVRGCRGWVRAAHEWSTSADD